MRQETFNFVVAVCLVIMTLLMIWDHSPSIKIEQAHVSPFADTSATAIMCKQVMEGRPTLCDKIDAANTSVATAAAAAAAKSTLTGSRDVPVFFQDYDYDMTRQGTEFKNEREGYQSRESFEDSVSNNAVNNVKSSELLDALKGY